MCVRYLGFVLLAWLPGLLHAQITCSPPALTNGYFVPQQETYNNGRTLTYSCETGFKPVAEGWWATSTCQKGEWTHTPRCVDSSSCLPPSIENGKPEEAPRDLYKNQDEITVACEDGFNMEPLSGRIQCSNGIWLPPLVCERSNNTCNEPDKIPHAVIIQEPKEVYGPNSRVEYQCENGYITRQANDRGTITCQNGTWTEAQPCIPAASACVLDLRRLNIGETSQININDGETKEIVCTLWRDYWMFARCSNGRIEATDCCHISTIDRNLCKFSEALKHFLALDSSTASRE
ncbi:complement factor H-related protein 1-like [Xiphophorus hellerii]|uniref:complement factor H-related protein 1-like n=1 Tax=Xiphophorus hellerii TaxID=8084 RepID=UPI0013B3ADCF|nr:complement factor H-related protein 1-like [Xiphophorus hellerii]